jgi:hypothetical protein
VGIPQILVEPIKALVRDLVRGDFELLVADGRAGRLSAAELATAHEDAGGTLVELPDEAFEHVDEHEIEGETDVWTLDVDLWTKEHGWSDLTLQLTARRTPDGVRLEIDSCHVL